MKTIKDLKKHDKFKFNDDVFIVQTKWRDCENKPLVAIHSVKRDKHSFYNEDLEIEMEKLSEKSEKKVKAIYPDAKVSRDGVMFFISTGRGNDKKDLGAGFSPYAAWCSAGYSLPDKT